MTRILSLFQIKTVRSAWVFFVGSGLLFVFGVYQAFKAPLIPSGDPGAYFVMASLSLWLLVAGLYMGIASLALFSEKGRAYIEVQEQMPIKGNRGVLWFLKFLFACFAAAFATIMLLGVLALPFAGFSGFEALFSSNSGLYLLVAGLVWSPLIFRFLK